MAVGLWLRKRMVSMVVYNGYKHSSLFSFFREIAPPNTDKDKTHIDNNMKGIINFHIYFLDFRVFNIKNNSSDPWHFQIADCTIKRAKKCRSF